MINWMIILHMLHMIQICWISIKKCRVQKISLKINVLFRVTLTQTNPNAPAWIIRMLQNVSASSLVKMTRPKTNARENARLIQHWAIVCLHAKRSLISISALARLTGTKRNAFAKMAVQEIGTDNASSQVSHFTT